MRWLWITCANVETLSEGRCIAYSSTTAPDSGDADFVPAAKLARREGVDFIIDPMSSHIADDLHEHIDGLRSTCPRPVGIGSSLQNLV